MRKEWRKFLQFILTVFLILVVFGFGTRIVNAEENREAAQSSEEDAEEDTGRIQQKVEDALLSEFDFDEIEEACLEVSCCSEESGFIRGSKAGMAFMVECLAKE